eukprot:TRINITY_DN498_c0_g2_i1.p1 TRINITY_DN498_c0_g2~~TRINITY_DN498_c0_g2_i1.p1  ORF type:complete len:294 (+),score=77.71 TRINITY_DN498_c0_g2_i1:65-883(+)
MAPMPDARAVASVVAAARQQAATITIKTSAGAGITPVPSAATLPANPLLQQQIMQIQRAMNNVPTVAAVAAAAAAQAATSSSGPLLQQYPPGAKRYHRTAAGQQWEDPSLAEWPESDFRIFVGDLGNEVNDDVLRNAFSRYASLQKAKVVRDRRSSQSKGYGFVSFADPTDFTKCLREMNGKYVGNRPCKLRKSIWKDRTDYEKLEKERQVKRRKSGGGPGGKKPQAQARKGPTAGGAGGAAPRRKAPAAAPAPAAMPGGQPGISFDDLPTR